MSQIIFGIVFFLLGYVYSKHRNNETHKKYMYSTTKLIEINFYYVLKEFMTMHDIARNALTLVLEKTSEDMPELKQENEQILKVVDRKFDHFGTQYIQMLQKISPHPIKYSTYKQVKEEFDKLINKQQEENKNARDTNKTTD